MKKSNRNKGEKDMEGYEQECAEVFLKEQCKLVPEPVVSSIEEAIEFLEDCFAVVLDSVEEIRAYWEEEGVDMESLSNEEILEQAEVFELPSGKYMVVEA